MTDAHGHAARVLGHLGEQAEQDDLLLERLEDGPQRALEPSIAARKVEDGQAAR